ncbi:MAG: HAD-IA family hydrolase [Ignavibacteria bacterium]|nr:HAD-IA family hydrolase [Ignavibacteria bacterium]
MEVLSSDEVLSGKPAPDIYLEITRRLGVPASETIVVEDSSNGILTGNSAGAKVVAVPNHELKPSPDALSKANVVIDFLVSLNSALGLIDGLGQ